MYKIRYPHLCHIKVNSVKVFLRRNSSKVQWMIHELDQAYVPHKVEKNAIQSSYFRPLVKDGVPFSLVLPPPNITGTLHLGHALTAAVEDTLVKWKQMQGIETVWVPGMDHAGIATQVVVEKKLWKEEGKTRHDIGREEFKEKVWKWKAEKGDVIGKQLRRLGCSLDWERELFTMDKERSKAVQTAFIRLFDEGLIYRSDHLVNWSCVLQSAISDIEVEHLTLNGTTHMEVPGYSEPVEFGSLFQFAYKLHDSDDEIVVATTRPETIPGDVAIAVHPKDERYTRFIGKTAWHPFRNEEIPVIADEFVDPQFSTGAVKITPAHDQSDFEVSKRHHLQSKNVIDETGCLIHGEFQGIPRFLARSIIVDRLAKMGLMRGKASHQMTVPICSRSKDIIELLVKPQWFVRCQDMAAKAVADVKEGRLKIEPKSFEKTWFNWLENIRDWCISRQLWWGHQIPAYSCHLLDQPANKIWVAAEDEAAALVKARSILGAANQEIAIERDADVLDTWFSSALQPFSAFGWPKKTANLSKFYPLSVMETGHDILFFWVARMVMLGTHLTGQLPFKEVLLHGIICDAHGRKMSKSVGNVVAPEDVIDGISLEDLVAATKASYETGVLTKDELEKALQGQRKMFPDGIPECGADALRFTLLSHNIKSQSISFDVKECHTNKLFCNKIWQATKFTRMSFSSVLNEQELKEVPFEHLTLMDKWILSRLSVMIDEVHSGLESYNFHICTAALKNFLYYDFCDIYLESTKRGLRQPSSVRAVGHCNTLSTCLDIGLRAMAPFMPFLAEHLHQRVPVPEWTDGTGEGFPGKLTWHDADLERNVDKAMEIVVAVRRLKKIFNITAKHKPEVYIKSTWSSLPDYMKTIQDLSACDKLTTDTIDGSSLKNSVLDTVGDVTIRLIVPEELKKAIELDVPKMEVKKNKLLKELAKMDKMLSGETYSTNATVEEQEYHSKKMAKIKDQLSRIQYIQALTR